MITTTAQIKTFQTFLESISKYCDDKNLMSVITEGFNTCHPLHESIIDDVKATLGKYVPAEKVEGFSNVVAKAMEKTGLVDVKEFIKKVLDMTPTPEFAEESVDFLGEAVLTEGVGDKIGKLAHIMAVAAMLASGAMASEGSDSTAVPAVDEAPAKVTQFDQDKTESLDDMLKKALGDKGMNYLKKKSEKNTNTVQDIGDKAKTAAGIQPEG